MEAKQETEENTEYEKEASQENLEPEEGTVLSESEEYKVTGEEPEEKHSISNNGEDRSSFIHGLAVGLGIGCIATFVIMWITIFFSPRLPQSVTYEGMLAVFIYPLVYLLAVGLVALTAGIVREYYGKKVLSPERI